MVQLPWCQWSNPERYGWNQSVPHPTKYNEAQIVRIIWGAYYVCAPTCCHTVVFAWKVVKSRFWLAFRVYISLKIKHRQFDNFVVAGGTVSCHNDNLRCHQWRQSCQIATFCFRCLWWLRSDSKKLQVRYRQNSIHPPVSSNLSWLDCDWLYLVVSVLNDIDLRNVITAFILYLLSYLSGEFR